MIKLASKVVICFFTANIFLTNIYSKMAEPLPIGSYHDEFDAKVYATNKGELVVYRINRKNSKKTAHSKTKKIHDADIKKLISCQDAETLTLYVLALDMNNRLTISLIDTFDNIASMLKIEGVVSVEVSETNCIQIILKNQTTKFFKMHSGKFEEYRDINLDEIKIIQKGGKVFFVDKPVDDTTSISVKTEGDKVIFVRQNADNTETNFFVNKDGRIKEKPNQFD